MLTNIQKQGRLYFPARDQPNEAIAVFERSQGTYMLLSCIIFNFTGFTTLLFLEGILPSSRHSFPVVLQKNFSASSNFLSYRRINFKECCWKQIDHDSCRFAWLFSPEMKWQMKNLTFTCSVGSTKYGALLYCTKGRKQLSDIVFCLLLAEHTHEQLSVCRLEEKKKAYC